MARTLDDQAGDRPPFPAFPPRGPPSPNRNRSNPDAIRSSPQSRSSPPPTGAADKRRIYMTTIRHVNHFIGLQLELEKTQRECDNWKVTQNSVQYSRIGPAARAKLDGIRFQYAKKLADIKTRVAKALTTIAELPELSYGIPLALHQDLDKREVISYISELKEWITELRDKQALDTTFPADVPSLPTESPVSAYRRQLSPSSDIHYTLPTYDEISSRIDVLERGVDQAREMLEDVKLFREYTNLSGVVDKKLEAQRESDVGKGEGEFSSESDALLQLSLQACKLDDDTKKQVESAALASQKIQSGEQLLMALRAEKEQNELINKNMRAQLAQFERQRKEDSERIRVLSKQVNDLQKSPSPLPPPTPLDIGEVVSCLKPAILAMIQQDILPVLDAIQVQSSSQIRDHNKHIHDAVWEVVGPMLATTEKISEHKETAVACKECPQE